MQTITQITNSAAFRAAAGISAMVIAVTIAGDSLASHVHAFGKTIYKVDAKSFFNNPVTTFVFGSAICIAGAVFVAAITVLEIFLATPELPPPPPPPPPQN